MRVQSACTPCRQAKRRCIRRSHLEACIPCSRRRLICKDRLRTGHRTEHVLHARRSHETTRIDTVQQPLESDLALPRGTIIELVDLYLEKFHGRPHSLFDPPTLQSQARDNTIRPSLLYAICALACRFSGNPDTRQQRDVLFAEAKRLLQADITNACVENVQACVLVALLSVGHGDVAGEIIFFRVATTMAEILNLDCQPTGFSKIQEEERHWIWLSLYVTDLWCLSGQGLHSQMGNMPLPPKFTFNDSAVLGNHELQSGDAGAVAGPDIWPQLATLMPLFAPIHAMNQSIANGDNDAAKLEGKVSHLAQKLRLWKTRLPPNAQMSPSNLQRQQRLGLGGILISLHLAYHHFSILLYFRFMETPRTTNAQHATYIERCKIHASSFSSLLLQSRQLKGCDVVYPNIAHMTTVASSVLVHTLLFGEPDELGPAREELSANFEALVEVTRYWPATSVMIDRLVLFQRMCLSSHTQDTHRLDGWMLDFLVNHSLERASVRDRLSNMDTIPDGLSVKARALIEQGRYVQLQFL